MLLGLIGYPLEHSLSPFMHNTALEKANIEGKYLLFEVLEEELRTAVEGLIALGAVGFNVTIPYKTKIIGLLDEITEAAQEIGAVNLVYKKGKGKHVRYVGDNSDALGFIRSLQASNIDPSAKKALVIGNGGAARAICIGLKKTGCEVTVTSRNYQPDSFWEQFKWQKLEPDLVLDTDIVVNCTPVGMFPNSAAKPVVDPALFNVDTLFCDIVYNPIKTELIRIAQETGHKTVTGEGMLLYQGAISFEKWFNQKAPIEDMRKTLLTQLKGGKLND